MRGYPGYEHVQRSTLKGFHAVRVLPDGRFAAHPTYPWEECHKNLSEIGFPTLSGFEQIRVASARAAGVIESFQDGEAMITQVPDVTFRLQDRP